MCTTTHKICSLKKTEKCTTKGFVGQCFEDIEVYSLSNRYCRWIIFSNLFDPLSTPFRGDFPDSGSLPVLLISPYLPLPPTTTHATPHKNLETETNALCDFPWPGDQGLQNDDCFWQRPREENLFTALSMSSEMGCCLSTSITKCSWGQRGNLKRAFALVAQMKILKFIR